MAEPFPEAEIGQVHQADQIEGHEQDGRAGFAEMPEREVVKEEARMTSGARWYSD